MVRESQGNPCQQHDMMATINGTLDKYSPGYLKSDSLTSTGLKNQVEKASFINILHINTIVTTYLSLFMEFDMCHPKKVE